MIAEIGCEADLFENLEGKTFVEMSHDDAICLWSPYAFGWAGDMAEIDFLAEDGSLDKADLFRRARAMVVADWQRIESIAEELMQHRALNRRAINRIMVTK